MPTPEAKGTVLVVDDAPEILELITELLRRDGYTVLTAADGASALDTIRDHDPDLVVLDLTLPDLDGMEVCRRLREFSDVFVLMLTARDDELDRIIGLKTGADDYVTKPFSPRELSARVEALLRRGGRRPAPAADQPDGKPSTDERSPADDEEVRTFPGGLVIRPLAREVEVGGTAVTLTRIEFDILDALSERPRMVHSRAVLRERVWGENWFGDDHVVDVHIANLRKKIDTTGEASHIRTVRGVGYRMENA